MDDTGGALVTNVFRGAPSARDGIRPGDFITDIDNTEIANTTEVRRAIAAIKPGETAIFRVIRQRQSEDLQVRLEQRATDEEIDNNNLWPGIVVAELTPALREDRGVDGSLQGVIALGVYDGTGAAKAGLRNGDIITAIGDRALRSTSDFYAALNGANSRRLAMTLVREGVNLTIELPNL